MISLSFLLASYSSQHLWVLTLTIGVMLGTFGSFTNQSASVVVAYYFEKV